MVGECASPQVTTPMIILRAHVQLVFSSRVSPLNRSQNKRASIPLSPPLPPDFRGNRYRLLKEVDQLLEAENDQLLRYGQGFSILINKKERKESRMCRTNSTSEDYSGKFMPLLVYGGRTLPPENQFIW